MRTPTKEPLTPRQLEVAQLTACGLLDKEIANRMNVSVSTVTNTKRNIYDKYGFNNTSEMVAFYFATYHKVSTDFDLVGKIKRAVNAIVLMLIVSIHIIMHNDDNIIRARRTRNRRNEIELIDNENEC